MWDKKKTFERFYDSTQPNNRLEEENKAMHSNMKRMRQDLEHATARIMLMATPSSNAYKDAERIRKKWNLQ